jgi:hypothetical protein
MSISTIGTNSQFKESHLKGLEGSWRKLTPDSTYKDVKHKRVLQIGIPALANWRSIMDACASEMKLNDA